GFEHPADRQEVRVVEMEDVRVRGARRLQRVPSGAEEALEPALRALVRHDPYAVPLERLGVRHDQADGVAGAGQRHALLQEDARVEGLVVRGDVRDAWQARLRLVVDGSRSAAQRPLPWARPARRAGPGGGTSPPG